MKKVKFGFSLGEVLLAMALIGVVAAVTMPTLLQNVNESKYRSLLKSFYSKFTVNLDSVLTNAGSAEGATPCDSFDCFNEISPDTFVTNNLFNATFCTGGCASVDNAQVPNAFSGGQFPEQIYSLANGMTMKIMVNPDGCAPISQNGGFVAQYQGNNQINLAVCALVYVDVNGDTGPNSFRHDMFAFYILPGKDIKQYDDQANEFRTVAHRSSQLLPLGLSANGHGHYTTYLSDNNNANNDCDGAFPQNLNCTAQMLDGEGYWKRRDSCWLNNDGDKKDCNKCNNGDGQCVAN